MSQVSSHDCRWSKMNEAHRVRRVSIRAVNIYIIIYTF